MIDTIKWYLMQCIPMTYRTQYLEDGNKKFTVWKMWLGKSYKIDTFTIL